MIKVEVNRGDVHIEEISGRTPTIAAELCGIVRAVCIACWEDEENGAELTETMITLVSSALVSSALKEVRPHENSVS